MSEVNKVQGDIQIVDVNTYLSRDVSGNMTFTDIINGTKTLADILTEQWSVSGADLYYLGLVGIGTEAPDFTLHIRHATTDAGIKLERLDTTAAVWFMYSGRQGNGEFSIADNSEYRLTILPDGNIGIGTNIPNAPLTVFHICRCR